MTLLPLRVNPLTLEPLHHAALSTTLYSMDPMASCDRISPNRRTASAASGTSTVSRISSMFLRSSLRPSGPPDDLTRQTLSRPASLPSSRSVRWSTHVEVWQQPSRCVSWSAHVEVFVIPAREGSPDHSNSQRVSSARDPVSGDVLSGTSTTKRRISFS